MIISAYCRVSTDSDDQINGLENQISYFKREIEGRGHQLYKIYYDEGLTGTKLNNRPDFERMLYDAGIDVKTFNSNKRDLRIKRKHTFYEVSDREPLFNEVWVKNTSRFARNTLSYEIISLLRQKGVNIFFIEQNINSNDMAQDMLLKLMQIFDEQDSKDKSLKVKAGIRESAKRGKIRTNDSFYGYQYIKDENRLEIIPHEAEVVKTVFTLYSEGYGIRRIINYLNEHHIYTRNNKSFVPITLKRMIDNEKYFGYNNPLKIDRGVVFQNYYPRAKKQGEYEIYKNDRIPPIISIELFQKCKDILKSRENVYGKVGVYNGLSKYANFIYCGECGCVYYCNTMKLAKGNFKKVYNCSTKKLKGVSYCDNINIQEAWIDEYIELLANGGLKKSLDIQFSNIKMVLYNLLKTKVDCFNIDNSLEIKSIEENISLQKNELEKYYDLFARENLNDIAKSTLMNKISKIEALIGTYCERLEVLQKDSSEAKTDLKEILESINLLSNLSLQDCVYRPEDIIDQFLSKITVVKTGTSYRLDPEFKVIERLDEIIAKYNISDKAISTAVELSDDEIVDIINKIKTL